MKPVVQKIISIHRLGLSVPANKPWTSAKTHSRKVAKCSERQTFQPMRPRT